MMPGTRVAPISVLAALLAVSGCSEARSPSPAWVTRDSAGIRIVTSARPEGISWRVAPEPAVSIGTVAGEPEYELSRVRGAMRLEDGRFVVADGGSSELRFFGPDGRYLEKFGRNGEGPGEFRSVWGIGRYRGDSLWAYDGALRRATILSVRDGAYRYVPNPAYWLSLFQAARADGSFYAWRFSIPEEFKGPPGFQWDSAYVFLTGPKGQSVDTLGRFGLRMNLVGLETRGGVTMMTALPFHFRPESVNAASDTSFYWGTADVYEIRQYDGTGRLARIIRRDYTPIPVTDELRREYIEAYIEALANRPGLPSPPGWLEARRRDMADEEFANTVPAFGRALVDRSGFLWVGEYHIGRRPEGDWDVFHPDGHWLGTVATPEGLHVYEIGTDYVLGLMRDELDVESVRLYRLAR